jgi:hypothetical protein
MSAITTGIKATRFIGFRSFRRGAAMSMPNTSISHQAISMPV